MLINLLECKSDGEGSVHQLGEHEYEVQVTAPFTLWGPEPMSGNAIFSFDCSVLTPNSAMLFFACARNWQGNNFFSVPRSGKYEDYSIDVLESYTIGFNRAKHVSTKKQPNASTANVRRIGGQRNYGKYPLEKLHPDGVLNLPLWNEWNRLSNLASVRETHSGVDCYYHYEFRFECPSIRLFIEGEEVLTVIDHLPEPLHGGYFAIRNMTIGARFRMKNFTVESLPDES